MVAIFAPAAFMRKLQWEEDQVDVSLTVLNWLSQSEKLVTFGAYTAEFELDIACSASLMRHGRISSIV